MKINEFTSAEDTLALWRVISDNTWAAVAQQAEAEAKQKAERAAARKSASKRGSGKSTAKPMPPKRLPPPLQHVTAPVPKADEKTSPATKPQTHKAQAHTAQPPSAQQVKQSQATTASSQQPSALPLQQKALDMSKSHPKYSQPPSQPYSTSNEPKQ